LSGGKTVGKTIVTYLVVLAILAWIKARLVTYPIPQFFKNALASLSYMDLVVFVILFLLILFIYQVHDLAEP